MEETLDWRIAQHQLLATIIQCDETMVGIANWSSVRPVFIS
jgi:hypothetical protein